MADNYTKYRKKISDIKDCGRTSNYKCLAVISEYIMPELEECLEFGRVHWFSRDVKARMNLLIKDAKFLTKKEQTLTNSEESVLKNDIEKTKKTIEKAHREVLKMSLGLKEKVKKLLEDTIKGLDSYIKINTRDESTNTNENVTVRNAIKPPKIYGTNKVPINELGNISYKEARDKLQAIMQVIDRITDDVSKEACENAANSIATIAHLREGFASGMVKNDLIADLENYVGNWNSLKGQKPMKNIPKELKEHVEWMPGKNEKFSAYVNYSANAGTVYSVYENLLNVEGLIASIESECAEKEEDLTALRNSAATYQNNAVRIPAEIARIKNEKMTILQNQINSYNAQRENGEIDDEYFVEVTSPICDAMDALEQSDYRMFGEIMSLQREQKENDENLKDLNREIRSMESDIRMDKMSKTSYVEIKRMVNIFYKAAYRELGNPIKLADFMYGAPINEFMSIATGTATQEEKENAFNIIKIWYANTEKRYIEALGGMNRIEEERDKIENMMNKRLNEEEERHSEKQKTIQENAVGNKNQTKKRSVEEILARAGKKTTVQPGTNTVPVQTTSTTHPGISGEDA